MLFECLAGWPPFSRDREVAVVYAHLQEEPPPLSEGRPDLPAALDAVIARALAKEPEQRYSSCRELARAALAVTVDDASRRLAEIASRAAAGRSDLSRVETELAGKVSDLQFAREQVRALSRPSTPSRVAALGVCPFKGLASFEPADADYFFGRERLIAELVARLVGYPFLGIVGPSGSGKSSVLRAGLLPALAGGVLPGSERWRRVLIRPGERPLDELRRMLASGANDPVAEALDALEPDERILLAVDQLEELFTACRAEEERAAFADMIVRAAADPYGRALVAVALRADFYGRFAAYPALAELLGAKNVLVGPMKASELRRAVELPAAGAGLTVAAARGRSGRRRRRRAWRSASALDQPARAVAETGRRHAHPGRLPRLRWRARRRRAPRREDLRSRSGRAQAARQGAHAAPGRRGRGDAAVRRRAPLAELDLERNPQAERVLATLADSRLVTVSEGAVELAHEALLREWPRLREWIEEDAQGRRLRRHITVASREWDEAGRDRAELYRGARLAAALDWSTDHASELNELEREFVTESREASEKDTKRVRRTNRRLHGLLVGVGVLLAAAVAGGVFAIVQRGEARDAAAEARDAETVSSPSASAPRRSSRRISTVRFSSPVRRSRSTTRRRPAATCSRPSGVLRR